MCDICSNCNNLISEGKGICDECLDNMRFFEMLEALEQEIQKEREEQCTGITV